MEKIRIKYFTDKIEKLTYIDGKSDWIDLRASEEVEMKAGEFKLIPLGVAMELPKGYEAHIMPRSSSYKNFGIIQANSCGIVDGSYCGDNDISSLKQLLLWQNRHPQLPSLLHPLHWQQVWQTDLVMEIIPRQH